MKTNTVCLFLFGSLLSISGMAQPGKDSTQVKRNYTIDEVVVTGTRNETDIRHLPMTISVVGRQQIEKRYEPSLLPLLTEQVPGLEALKWVTFTSPQNFQEELKSYPNFAYPPYYSNSISGRCPSVRL